MKKLGWIVLALFVAVSPVVVQEADAAKIKVNVASIFPPSGPIHEGIVKFKEVVEKNSDGRIAVTIHPSGALGGERELVESLKAGTIEMGAEGIMDLVAYMPQYTVFEEPFVIRDLDHLRKFWKSIGREINDKVAEEQGIMTPAVAVRGARYMTSNKPIKTPEDLKGVKLRMPQYPVRIAVFEALGAIPTVVAFPEVYLALKTGTVGSQENPPETIFTYKFYEAQKYLIATQHVWSTARYHISKKWFDTLDEKDQTLILDSWKEAEKYVESIAYDPDAIYVKKLEEAGMTLIKPDMEAFRKIAEPVLKEFNEKTWAPGLLERIQAIQ